MQSFKQPSNFRNDPNLRAIEKKHGETGYTRALKLFEVVAETQEFDEEVCRPYLGTKVPR